jgi:hypothetical protein
MKYKLTLESEGSVILFGTFNTAPGAIAMAKLIIENSLSILYNDNMTLEQLLKKYRTWGDIPIIETDEADCKFDSEEYAKEYAAKFIEEQGEHIDDIELHDI